MTEVKNKFLLTRSTDGKFKPMTGLRDWLAIRDLGLSQATHGQFDAWVTRAVEMGQSTGKHYHNYDFQMMFVLKGWVKKVLRRRGREHFKRGRFCLSSQRTCSRFFGLF